MSNNVTEILSSLSFDKLSIGFIMGLAIGYFLKKGIKLALFIGGLLIIGLFALQYYGIIEINNHGLLTGADRIVALLKAIGTFAKEHLASLEKEGAGGATAGFLLGLKIG